MLRIASLRGVCQIELDAADALRTTIRAALALYRCIRDPVGVVESGPEDLLPQDHAKEYD